MAVTPVKALRQLAVPAIIAVVGIGSRDPSFSLLVLPVVVGVAALAGLLPWLTTAFTVRDGQLRVRRGLLNRTTVTANLDRVRSVDLEANLLHRVLGLARVTIGTGVDDTRIELDALDRDRAEELRRFLLQRRAAVAHESAEPVPAGPVAGPPAPPAPVEEPVEEPVVELARIDWSWLRFAPLNLARLVLVAGAVGVVSQVAEDLPLVDWTRSAWVWVAAQALAVVIPVAVVLAVVGWVLLSVTAYVVQWWDLRLVRGGSPAAGTLRLTAGLFTTRSTSVELARVRGLRQSRPGLMRLAGGAELATYATGVEKGVTSVLPPCPREVTERVSADLLGDVAPMTVDLVPHGPRARRRLRTQSLLSTATLAVLGVGGGVLLDWVGPLPWLVPALVVADGVASVVAAELRYRHLGHALTRHHLVTGGGTLSLRREVLERGGVIGWVVTQTFFQRRRGLATLVATTAAGPEKVVVPDLPLTTAVGLAHAATPGVLDEFVVPAAPPALRGRRA
jgi:putative membrane protein